MKKLLIVESPNKIDTIKKLLNNSEYDVIASKGHIRELAKRGKYGFGVDLETFEPMFKDDPHKEQIIQIIKEATSKADVIYLATDPDREGEAIAWHIDNVMHKKDKKVKRITFNEITKPAIEEAIKKPRDLDINLVQSQLARRIVDRIIGFRLSHFTRTKLDAESAGRVQSIALKIVVDKEKEIEAFESITWWTIDVGIGNDVNLILRKIEPEAGLKLGIDYNPGTESSEIKFNDPVKPKELLESLNPSNFIVYRIDDPEMRKENSSEPLKTSTLQQEASTKYGMNPTKTMKIAQELYEGVMIDGKNIGLITYPRTDATKLSDTFTKHAFDFIRRVFGQNYVGAVKVGKSAKNSQEAHEAIRPTNLNNNPLQIKDQLTLDQQRLYGIIWRRAITSLMAPAVYERQVIRIVNGPLKFYAKSRKMLFDGWRKVDQFSNADFEVKELNIPSFAPGTKIKAQTEKITEHKTKPPARYTQASLVKDLEELGIGRPSTFSTMLSTNLKRKYYLKDGKSIYPSKKGRETIDSLTEYFPGIINIDYTSKLEDDLDDMANGNKIYQKELNNFWSDFSKHFENMYSKAVKVEKEKTGKMCPNCGSALVYSKSRNGKFIGCENFPKCKYTESINKPKYLEERCPQCDSKLVIRKNKKGQEFIACTGFPECRYLRKKK